MSNTSLPEFYDMLAKHDWWHEMSDDNRIASAGREQLARLQQIAKQSNRHETLFNAYELHAKRGFEKPNRPFIKLGWNTGNGNHYVEMPGFKNRKNMQQLVDLMNETYGAKTHWFTEEWEEL